MKGKVNFIVQVIVSHAVIRRKDRPFIKQHFKPKIEEEKF